MTLGEFVQMYHAALIAYCHPLQQWTACCHLPMYLQVQYVNAWCSLLLQLHQVHPHQLAVQICKFHPICGGTAHQLCNYIVLLYDAALVA